MSNLLFTIFTLITKMYDRVRITTSLFGSIDDQFTNASSYENVSYVSFHDVKNYAFAKWMFKYKMIKNAIDAFLRDANFEIMHEKLNYRNDDEWLTQLHRITHDIFDDDWTIEKFNVENEINDLTNIDYNFHYRNVLKMMRFLLDYELFHDNFLYAFVRIKNTNDVRIYIDINTNDWWWKLQNQLSMKITIVSIIIIIDKTQMTQHHENQNLWSMYMTIDNLNRITKRNQIRFDFVLINLISIVKIEKKHKVHLIAKIYHWAM